VLKIQKKVVKNFSLKKGFTNVLKILVLKIQKYNTVFKNIGLKNNRIFCDNHSKTV